MTHHVYAVILCLACASCTNESINLDTAPTPDSTSDAPASDTAPDTTPDSASDAGTDNGSDSASACYTIEVQKAVYAANCGAPTSMPTIAAECDAKHNCTYVVDTANKDPKGDPAPGCWKDLSVNYNCMSPTGVAAQKNASASMVHDGTELTLTCCPP